jgi:hypothetical protein
MIIDDEPPALTAMLDALARRFGGDYQVVSHLQVTTALAELEKIKQDGNKVALVIADQWGGFVDCFASLFVRSNGKLYPKALVSAGSASLPPG